MNPPDKKTQRFISAKHPPQCKQKCDCGKKKKRGRFLEQIENGKIIFPPRRGNFSEKISGIASCGSLQDHFDSEEGLRNRAHERFVRSPNGKFGKTADA